MSERTARITRIGSVAGYVVAVSGVIWLVTIGPFFRVGQLSLLVEFAALAPLMLSFYELGGRTPTPLAQLAQAVGWISVIVFCAAQALLIGGAVIFDYDQPAVDTLAVSSLAWGYVGAWIAGANLLAGPWLNWVRWLGLVAGTGGVLLAFGLMVGGMNSVWVLAGGLGFQVVLPVWAFLMARLLGARQRAAS